jgi:N-methylhydantoinase B/oxoprolinase/acetone carboxylase alpha subunit
MNNVTFGNDRFTYYETIGGGQGASPGADGPSGVHVTMSNTLSTPTEALELAYPLQFAATPRLGPAVMAHIAAVTAHQGDRGAGALPFLGRERAASSSPEGVDGGDPGQPGRNLLNGAKARGQDQRRPRTGDVLTVEPPKAVTRATVQP